MMAIKTDFTSTTFGDRETGIVVLVLLLVELGPYFNVTGQFGILKLERELNARSRVGWWYRTCHHARDHIQVFLLKVVFIH